MAVRKASSRKRRSHFFRWCGPNPDFAVTSGGSATVRVETNSTYQGPPRPVRSSLYQAFADGIPDQLTAVMEVKLAHQVDFMSVDRFDTQV
jgi:hypothetical protein